MRTRAEDPCLGWPQVLQQASALRLVRERIGTRDAMFRLDLKCPWVTFVIGFLVGCSVTSFVLFWVLLPRFAL